MPIDTSEPIYKSPARLKEEPYRRRHMPAPRHFTAYRMRAARQLHERREINIYDEKGTAGRQGDTPHIHALLLASRYQGQCRRILA